MISLLILFFCSFHIAYSLCPPKLALHPCTCETDSADGIDIVCADIDNAEVLRLALQSLKNKRVASLKLKRASLQYLPHDVFQSIALEELELEESSLLSFSDHDDKAFEGLENVLGQLMITDCHFMSGWDWSLLKNMKELFRIDVVGGDMDSIGEDIAAIEHLPIKDLAFSRNRISWVHERAFSKYEEMISLTLDNNEISTLKRSMFPKPAMNLLLIDLAHNKLEELEDDIFTDMPNLTTLSLGYNLLTTLSENVFSPLWLQLELFGTIGNPLRCDCRVLWITTKKSDQFFRAVCTEPPSLKGQLVQSLTKKQLYC